MKSLLGRLAFITSWTLLISLIQPSQISWSDSPGVSPTEVTFGAAYSKSGARSPGMSSFYQGVQTYFSFVNESGGIYGRKLSLLERDSKGLPTQAVVATSQLVTVDQVFGLFNNAPDCPEQLAATTNNNLGSRLVPNILVECYLADSTSSASQDQASAEQPSVEDFKIASYNRVSINREYQILKSFIEKNFPDKRIAIVYADNHFRTGMGNLIPSFKAICTQRFVSGAPFIGVCNSLDSPLRDGDVVIFAGRSAELISVIRSYSEKLKLRYFVNTEAFNLEAIKALGVNVSQLPEIYTLTPFASAVDSVNPFIKTFTDISLKYAPKISINQQYLNGMNSAYIVASVLGAVGKDLTRERFLEALAKYGNSFDALGLIDRSSDSKSTLLPLGGYVVKFQQGESSIASAVLTVNSGQITEVPRKSLNLAVTGIPAMTQLLPPSAPKPEPIPTTIPEPVPITSPSPAIKPAPKVENEPALDGEDEEPFAKLTIKREKSKYTFTITGNIADEQLLVRATKKGQKSILFKIKTNDDGFARFTTTRILSGYQVSLSLDGEILSSVKAS